MHRILSALLPVLVIGLVLTGCDSGGGVPSDLGDETSVALSETDATVGEGDAAYTVDLTISDPGFKEVPVDVSFNASQSTATRGEDLRVPADTTVRFPESTTSGGSVSFDIPIIDDQLIEQEETAVFNLSVPDSVQAQVSSTQLTLTIENDDFFGLLADEDDLEPASGNTDAHCIVQRSSGEVVFFNSSEGGIFSYGDGLTVERSASDLNADIAAESNTIDRCDGVAKDDSDNVYFLFRSSNAAGTNHVYKLPPSGSPTVLGSDEGLGGLAHYDGTVYLAAVAFDGAAVDGFFDINDTDAGQPVADDTVASDPNLDLGNGMDVDENGNLYAFSGGFGGTENRTRKIVRVTDPVGSATIETFVDPYRQGSPLIPDSGSDIGDVDIVNRNGESFLVVYNGSFNAENGDQWGSIRISDQSIDLLFNRTQLIEHSPAGDFVSGFTEPVAVNNDGEVFVASRQAFFGGEHYIARVVDQLP